MAFNYFRASVVSAIRRGLHPDRDELLEYLAKEKEAYPAEVEAYLKRQTKQPRGRPKNTSVGYRRYKRAAVSEYHFCMATKGKNIPAFAVKLDVAEKYGISDRALDDWIAEQKQRIPFVAK